ncbi:MAG: Rho termination factor N-terminal domain-containing protein, partial [Lachnospiraceae bacterium]
MQENLSSLPLTQLREMAKERGVKRITSIRKSDLVDILQKLMEEEETSAESAVLQQEPQNINKNEDVYLHEQTGEEKKQSGSGTAERKNSDYSEKNRFENTGRTNPRIASPSQEISGEGYQRNGRSYRVNRNNLSYDNRNSGGIRYGNDNRNNSDNRYAGDNRNGSDSRSAGDNRNSNDSRYGSDNRNSSDSRYGSDNRNSSDSRYGS